MHKCLGEFPHGDRVQFKGGAGDACAMRSDGRRSAIERRCARELARMKRKNRFYLSFHHRKKLFYVISSMILSSVLLFTGVFDIMVVLLLQNPNLSTHKFMKTVMVRSTATELKLMCDS